MFVLVLGVALTSPNLSNHSFSSPHIERTATVLKVIDGDTILLGGGEKVRLAGINAPKFDELLGAEAKEFVEALCPPGSEVGLNVDDLNPEDRHGRTLVLIYVKVGSSWTNLNAELLQSGLAEVMFIPPSEFNPYGWMS